MCGEHGRRRELHPWRPVCIIIYPRAAPLVCVTAELLLDDAPQPTWTTTKKLLRHTAARKAVSAPIGPRNIFLGRAVDGRFQDAPQPPDSEAWTVGEVPQRAALPMETIYLSVQTYIYKRYMHIYIDM